MAAAAPERPERPADVEDWRCPVCMEMLCKPVVNDCGHVFCFWCMHRAMDGYAASSACPMCRGSYNHLPDVCEILHAYLGRTFPKEYAIRLRENRTEEEIMEVYSPEPRGELVLGTAARPALTGKEREGKGEEQPVTLEGRALIDALEQQAPRLTPDPAMFTCGFDDSCVHSSGEAPPRVGAETSEPETSPDDADRAAADARSPPRGHIMWEPVVLTCGHAVCKGCDRRRLRSPKASSFGIGTRGPRPSCPVCNRAVVSQSPPEMCLALHETIVRECGAMVLDPTWVTAREAEWDAADAAAEAWATEEKPEASLLRVHEGTESGKDSDPSPCPARSGGGWGLATILADAREGDGVGRPETDVPAREPPQEAEADSSLTGDVSVAAAGGPTPGPVGATEAAGATGGSRPGGAPRLRRRAPPDPATFTHHGVGCDVCGVFPIQGRRYKCLDCPDAVGFDLCHACHASNLDAQSRDDGAGIVRGRFNQTHRPEHVMEEVVPRPTLLHFFQDVHPELTWEQIMELLRFGADFRPAPRGGAAAANDTNVPAGTGEEGEGTREEHDEIMHAAMDAIDGVIRRVREGGNGGELEEQRHDEI